MYNKTLSFRIREFVWNSPLLLTTDVYYVKHKTRLLIPLTVSSEHDDSSISQRHETAAEKRIMLHSLHLDRRGVQTSICSKPPTC